MNIYIQKQFKNIIFKLYKSNQLAGLTIDEFYEKGMFNGINTIIYNEKYYYEVSNFKKIKVQKHAKHKIFFNYVENNKTELKTLQLDKIIYVDSNELDAFIWQEEADEQPKSWYNGWDSDH